MKRVIDYFNGSTIVEQSLLVAVLLFLVLKAQDTLGCIGVVLATLFYYLRTKDKSVFLVCLLFASCLIPRYQYDPTMHEGRVIKVYTNSAIVQDGRSRVFVQTKKMPILDSTIQFTGKRKVITSSLGFYEFDFQRYMKHRGVTESVYCESMKEIQETTSLRGKVQESILRIDHDTKRDLLLNILLKIRPRNDMFDSFLNDAGFSYASILLWCNASLKYFVTDRKREVIDVVVSLCLGVLYHMPYLILQHLIYICLKHTKYNGKERCGLGMIIGMLVMPECIDTASFLVPSVFRLVGCFSKHKKFDTYYTSLCMQSYLFHGMNPVLCLCYRQVMVVVGFMYVVAWLSLLVGFDGTVVLTSIDTLLSFFNRFDLKGSLLGFGLPFYLLCVFVVRKSNHKRYYMLGSLLVFQLFGLFHPFATFTFVNVGQGDGMVYCAPFQKETIIFDTGKPSAYRHLSGYLDAKGIKHVDLMCISHQDLDHCGNKETLKDVYFIDEVIEEHREVVKTKTLTLYDLNTIRCEDENRSSLVHLVKFNGLELLLMGDADVVTEKEIVHKYDALSCDVLKLSHHGSNTGSCSDFLDLVKPHVAIVSSGPYHLYHHPNPHVIERLNKRRIPYLDTFEEGDITIVAIGKKNVLLTSKYHFAILS